MSAPREGTPGTTEAVAWSSAPLLLDGAECAVERGPRTWTVVLRRSIAPVRDLAELDLLAHDHDGLMPCRVVGGEDTVTLELDTGRGCVPWSHVLDLPHAERLRALLNVADLAALVDRGYAVLLHPDNLVVDRNLRPRLGYRGLAGVMPPEGSGAASFLRQYQALVLSTFDPRASFTDLVAGAAVLRRTTALERAVTGATSVPQLVEHLTALHEDAAAVDAATRVRVGRRTHRALRQATVWLAVVALAATAATAHDRFVRAPFQERLLTASAQFVAMDHEGVIETLRPVDPRRLPAAQLYELARSYVQGADLSDEQRVVVENTLSLSSDRDLLTYWVLVGRGELDAALDTAKKLDDVDLVLYALTLLQEQVRSDDALSGTAREQRLDELAAAYDTYLAARAEAVAQGSAAGAPGPTDTPDAVASPVPEG